MILVFVALATVAMRCASAAARHLVWFVGTLSLIVLPILSLTLPGWHVLPAWATPNTSRVEPQTTAPVAGAVANSAPELAATPLPIGNAPARTNRAIPSSAESAAAPPPAPLRVAWQSWVVLAWLAGSAVLLMQIALGALSLFWLRRRSSRIADGRWPILASEIAEQLGIRRPVELLSSSRRTMPMVWGLWRIRVLLPEESAHWTPEQCRVVLLHELAHARRFDCLTQLVSQLACAVCWFNPLVWLARWRMQIERELACDDLVLTSGTKASAYAEQLVRIASRMPVARYGAAAIAMARASTLEGRVVAILDTTRNRRRIAATGAILVTVAVGLCAVALAALRAEVNRDPPAGFGRVVNVQGRPIAGATLTDAATKWSTLSGTDGLFPLPKIQRPRQFGKFNLTVEAVGFARRDDVMLLLDPSGALLEQSLLVDVSKRPTEGRGIIQLQRPGRVEGRVLGLDGKPLAAAPLVLDVADHFDGRTSYVGNAANTVTDARGRFTLDNIAPGELLLYYPGSNARPPIKDVGAGARLRLADGQTLKDVVLDLSKSTAVATGRIVRQNRKGDFRGSGGVCLGQWRWMDPGPLAGWHLEDGRSGPLSACAIAAWKMAYRGQCRHDVFHTGAGHALRKSCVIARHRAARHPYVSRPVASRSADGPGGNRSRVDRCDAGRRHRGLSSNCGSRLAVCPQQRPRRAAAKANQAICHHLREVEWYCISINRNARSGQRPTRPAEVRNDSAIRRLVHRRRCGRLGQIDHGRLTRLSAEYVAAACRRRAVGMAPPRSRARSKGTTKIVDIPVDTAYARQR